MTYAEMMKNPEHLDSLLRRARCERAQVMYRLLVVPVKRWFAY